MVSRVPTDFSEEDDSVLLNHVPQRCHLWLVVEVVVVLLLIKVTSLRNSNLLIPRFFEFESETISRLQSVQLVRHLLPGVSKKRRCSSMASALPGKAGPKEELYIASTVACS